LTSGGEEVNLLSQPFFQVALPLIVVLVTLWLREQMLLKDILQRLGRIEDRLGKIEDRLHSLERKIDALELKAWR
jgi:hypothetical protein